MALRTPLSVSDPATPATTAPACAGYSHYRRHSHSRYSCLTSSCIYASATSTHLGSAAATSTGSSLGLEAYLCSEITGWDAMQKPFSCNGQAEACGDSVCGAGEVCCNASCGICTPPDGVCIQVVCL